MDEQSDLDYVYCPHCKETVAKSTYRRHQLSLKRKHELLATSTSSSDSDESSSESSSDSLDPPNSSRPSSIENGKLRNLILLLSFYVVYWIVIESQRWVILKTKPTFQIVLPRQCTRVCSTTCMVVYNPSRSTSILAIRDPLWFTFNSQVFF